MHNPLVTIVIPSFNYGRFLIRAVDSALAQTYPNIEVIIVDDCSTDDTKKIGMQLEEMYSNVKYLRQEKNVGQSANRNTGIFASNGEFVALLDADDWLDERYIDTAMKKFDDGVGAVYQFKVGHYQNGKVQLISNQKIISNPARAFDELFVYNFIGTSVVFRKGAIPNGYETNLSPHLNNLGVDWWILLELSTRYKIVGVDTPYYQYNFHDGPQMSNNLIRRMEADRIIQNKFLNENPTLLSKKVLYEAMYYRHIREGFYMRTLGNKWNAILSTLYAIIYNPFNIKSYKALIVSLLRS